MPMYAGCWFLLFLPLLAAVASFEECPCELNISHDDGMVAYLEQFARNEMEKSPCCRNHGTDFSTWGQKACPTSFQEIYMEAKMADGAKSEQVLLITDRFVIKKAAPHEVESIDAILAKMHQSNGTRQSLIAPICRRIRVTRPGFHSVTVTVSLNMRIKNSHMFRESLLFDLKGNPGFRAGTVPPSAKNKKDADFREQFPAGVHITDSLLLENMRNTIAHDTEMLNESRKTGYALLLQMVELCERPIQNCPGRYSVDAMGSRPGPPGKPFELGNFHKTCVRLEKGHASRPVYATAKKEFMYYYHGAWRIGRDIYKNDRTLFAEMDSNCPSAKVTWGSSVGDQFKVVPMRVNSEDNGLDLQSKDAIKKANPHVPLAFAVASTKEGNKTYAISYSLRDAFTKDNQKGSNHKHYFNAMREAITASECRQDDITQLDSSPYRARFLMMWNHRLNESCLARNSYFTYFPRTDELQAVEDCPEGETMCKTLCKHLGLAAPSEPNGQCDAVEAILDACRSPYHGYGFGNFWSSSQKRLEDLLRKNVWASQVMYLVKEIREEMNFMPPDKKAKYAKCHVQINQALDKFEASTHDSSDNRESCGIDDSGKNQKC